MGTLVLAAGVGSLGSSAGASPTAHTATKPYTIVLSNNYLGNDWRIQMEKEATVAATLSPFKGVVSLRVVNADNTVTAQISSLDSIIASKPDAIIIDAGSPTALNPEIAKACSAGIVVINFDQVTTAPCAYKIFTNFTAGETAAATWLASVLKGKGEVFEDTGLAGVPISATITDAWNAVLAKNPGIKVEGTYQGQYALAPEQQGVSSLLTAHPKVSAILTQGYCTGAIAALKADGDALVPMLCQAYNGTFLALAKDKGASGFIMANPAWLSVLAIQAAVNVLEGKTVAKTDEIVPPCFYAGGTSPTGYNCQAIKVGVNAFPSLSPLLTNPASPPFMTISPASIAP
jgi:ribose transport system substrate-binding protein